MEIRNFDNIILFRWDDMGVLVGLVEGILHRRWVYREEIDNLENNLISLELARASSIFLDALKYQAIDNLTNDEKRALPLWLKEELMLQILKE